MTPERYNELDRTGVEPTPEEAAEGWHYCGEFDLMLICAEDREWALCKCFRDDSRRKIEDHLKSQGKEPGKWPVDS